MPRPDDGTQMFETHRPRLVRLAYRMLGSVAEAEDVVQGMPGCAGSRPIAQRWKLRLHSCRAS
jgi:hypothetical protein